METAVIIQARMGSSRLPGKVLEKIVNDVDMLELVVGRLRDRFPIIVATTSHQRDNPIEAKCRDLNIKCYRGSENDVLERYFQAATIHRVKNIIRITSDCPFIDPNIVQLVVDQYQTQNYDYVSNILHRSYPRGLDCEIFSYQILNKIHKIAEKPEEREHVTCYIYTHPSEFKIGHVINQRDESQYRLTVDTPEDLDLARKIYSHLSEQNHDIFQSTLTDFIEVLKNHPDWTNTNEKIQQKYDSQSEFLNSSTN